jgi:DNA-directed RNA polymerase specialized sigma24 family protein
MRTPAELVSAVLAGERSAYAELVRLHERAVVAACWAVLCDLHLAQDVAQEAFVAAFDGLAGAARAVGLRRVGRADCVAEGAKAAED